ncbi:MAG: hypothetical protein EZS28_020128 [Streblomastix strix]|uniref:Uncharacterized protein n=1 Tax=Streblomastix strix TaxID=222440 RepID=A0A5J4VP82_9EUKA|nr:MAG: hypothetical protein EZS28_020128 [Streblomastix strix]
MTVASVPTVLAIPTIPPIRDSVNIACCELVQLRKRSSNRKRIQGKRTSKAMRRILLFQFHTIRRIMSECWNGHLECGE